MLKTLKKIWKFVTSPYRIFYAFYYVFNARRIIKNPKPIIPPKNAISCRTRIVNPSEGEENFLYVKIKPESKWKFYKRKFAVTFNGVIFYELPSFTPWKTDEYTQEGEIKFGLNHLVIEEYPNIKNIITWI